VSGFVWRSGDCIRLSVRLQPRSSRNEIAGFQGDRLKVRITAPPVEGMANEALIDFLSESLKISRRNVCIVSGHSSRNKIVEIRGAELEEVQRLAD